MRSAATLAGSAGALVCLDFRGICECRVSAHEGLARISDKLSLASSVFVGIR